MYKKLYINIAIIILTYLAILFIGKLVGGPAKQLITWGVNAFVVTFTTTFLIGLAGLGPIGTTPKISCKKGLAIASVCVTVVAFFCGGIFAAAGAALGAAITWAYFRGAL